MFCPIVMLPATPILPPTTRAPVLIFALFVVFVIVTIPLVLILPVAPIPPATRNAPVTLLVLATFPLIVTMFDPPTVAANVVAFGQ